MKRLPPVLFLCCIPLTSHAADSLGERVLWSIQQTTPSQWKTAPGISVAVEAGSVTLQSKDVDYGWAAPDEVVPFVAGSMVDLEVGQVANGQLGVQVEWLRENGSFMKAINLLKEAGTGARLQARALNEFLPEGEKPKSFKLKFWVEGMGAEAQVRKATIRFERKWRKADTRLIKAYDATASPKADEGMKVQPGPDGFQAQLDGKPFAAFTLEDKVDYANNGVVLVDLARLGNGVASVQALCWSKDDAFLKSVDLLKDIPASGVYEVPLRAMEEQFATETAKLSFKIWLAGNGTSAEIAGLFYGISP